MSTQSVSASLPHIKAGKLRPLASFGGKRSALVPDVPTLKELGYDVEYYLWVGIFAPKGTSSNIVAALSAAIDKAGASDAYKTAMSNAGLQADYLNAADFTKFWAEDAKRSDEAIKLIGRVQG
jgi:tripartite-type tricarboxylate transporter receptor subunit TctC